MSDINGINDTISIPVPILNRIKKGIGYPIIDLPDIGLTEQQLLDVVLRDYWEKYWEWNPLLNLKEYQVEGQFSFAFPDVNTFGIVDARINNQYFAAVRTGNPLVNEVMISSIGRYRIGSYGTRYDYDMNAFNVYKQIERQSVIDTYRAFRVQVDSDARIVYGYSNIGGMLSISWADYSLSWNDVPFKNQTDLIRYLQGGLEIWYGEMLNRGTIQMEGEVNGDALIDEGKELRDLVQERWQQQSKVVIQRG